MLPATLHSVTARPINGSAASMRWAAGLALTMCNESSTRIIATDDRSKAIDVPSSRSDGHPARTADRGSSVMRYQIPWSNRDNAVQSVGYCTHAERFEHERRETPLIR